MISSAIRLSQEVKMIRDERTVSKMEYSGPVQTPPVVEVEKERMGVTLSDLLHASANGYTMIVRYVLAAGIDVNGRNEHGLTALSVAATQEVRDILMDAGATESKYAS